MKLQGIPVSSGISSGSLQIITESNQPAPNNIIFLNGLSYYPGTRNAIGVIMDIGGRTSHAAILCREMGIPCVVGVDVNNFTDGQHITLDGDKGVIYINE